jgi:hypothetical protein
VIFSDRKEMAMRLHLLLGVVAAFASNTAMAGEAEKAAIDSWYKALTAVDRTSFANLLDETAKITLGDLDTVQTKAEFIASLDEWEDAMKGTTLRHAVESDAEGLVTVTVCYIFPDNESLTREIFGFTGGRIVSSEQETVADSCAEFPG